MFVATPIFVLGGVAFYALLLLATALFFYCTENDDSPGWTVFGVVLFILAWLLFGDLLPLLREHPWLAILDVLAWVGIGMAWSFPRWIIFLKRVVKEYNAAHASYLTGTTQDYVGSTYVTKPNDEAGWIKSGSYSFISRYGMSWSKDGIIQPPAFAPNRKRLVAWVALWPWSFVWTFAREVIVKGLTHLVNFFGGTYQRISAWVGSGLK